MTLPTVDEVRASLTAPGQPFEMDEVVIRGITTRVWKHAPPTLRAVLDAARSHGERDFIAYVDVRSDAPADAERHAFDRHWRDVMHLAAMLRDRFGVVKGDRVAIAMRNLPEWSTAFFAATAVGAVAVPLNAWWTGAELRYGLVDSGAAVLFCDEPRYASLATELNELPDLRTVVVTRPEAAVDRGRAGRVVAYADVMGDGPTEAMAFAVPIEPDDDATIFYSSGTTGKPKGVVGTHRNACTNLVSLGYNAARTAMRTTDPAAAAAVLSRTDGANASLLSVPLFHVTGCISILLPNLYYGGKLVMMSKWDAGRALELIEQERITNFGGVPAVVWQVLDHPDFARHDTSSIRSISYGGAPAAPELVRRIEAMFPGRSPSNGYGLTETSAVTTMNSGADYVRKPDSVGLPVAVCDLMVVGADGEPAARGDVGELWVKGPNVVKGYFGQPAATAAAFTDGWLHTGDVARLDEEGFVYIVDRAKDVVIRGGENVYCVEVEAALYEHPAVSDAAVIGLPHRVLGEEVGAVVHVLAGSTVTEEELRVHVAARLAPFKVPVRIWLRPEPLPRNPAGKILKRELRDELASG